MIEFVILFLIIIPPLALVFFGVSLFCYIHSKRKNKRVPGTYSDERIKRRKICLIVSSAIEVTVIAAQVTFTILLARAIAHM